MTDTVTARGEARATRAGSRRTESGAVETTDAAGVAGARVVDAARATAAARAGVTVRVELTVRVDVTVRMVDVCRAVADVWGAADATAFPATPPTGATRHDIPAPAATSARRPFDHTMTTYP